MRKSVAVPVTFSTPMMSEGVLNSLPCSTTPMLVSPFECMAKAVSMVAWVTL